MNRGKVIFTSLRLARSVYSNPLVGTRCLPSQVTRSLSFLSKRTCNHDFMSAHQKLFFSSTPNSIADLILNKEWSEDLVQELRNSNPGLTHETVIYVLKRIDKDPEKTSAFFDWACDENGFTPSNAVYSLLLRTFATGRSMKFFWVNVRKMKKQGLYIDKETYVTIVGTLHKARLDSDATAFIHFYNIMVHESKIDDLAKKVAIVISRSETWDDNVVKELGEIEISLSDNFVIRVLKLLYKMPLKALRFFKWAGQSPDYRNNTITYNAIVKVLARAESIAEFWDMIGEMKAAGHELDIDMYVKISRVLQKSKMMEDTVKLYEFMMDGPYKPSNQDCVLLLRAISSKGKADLNLVFRVVKKYEATGNLLSKGAYDGIHRSLTRVGRFDEADEIVKTMENAGYTPDNVTYSQLVFGLCRALRLEEASKVLDVMEARGCSPDIKTWTVLIQGCCEANDLDKASVWFAKMREANVDPDADLLEVLVNAFLSQNAIDGAYTLLVEMVDRARVRPWQATYKIMIDKLLGERKLEEASNLLHLMKKHNYPIYVKPFDQYIAKFGTVENALEYLKVISFKDYATPTAHRRVLECFFKEGRHSEAKDLFFKCPYHIRNHSQIRKLFGSANSSWNL